MHCAGIHIFWAVHDILVRTKFRVFCWAKCSVIGSFMLWCRPETFKCFSTTLQPFNVVSQHKINSSTIEQPNTKNHKCTATKPHSLILSWESDVLNKIESFLPELYKPCTCKHPFQWPVHERKAVRDNAAELRQVTSITFQPYRKKFTLKEMENIT